MWKAAAGTQIQIEKTNADDDWETDPDFINDVTEQEQRWGSTTIEGSGRTVGAIDMEKLRKETEEADALKKKKELSEGPNPSFGYGGKFGVQKDRMDSCAVGNDYVGKVEKHASQKDYSTGFGGKFGVQTDRIDKSAVTWEHKEKLQKHASQKDYATGFGGKFGVQTDRQDRSAVGWDHVEKIEKHESQKDYSVGFGGKFGVQKDRQDKSAVGWDHHEAPQKHESQIDHKVGFGGKFGVQTDRMDKSAVTFNDEPSKVGTTYTKPKPDVGSVKPSDLKAKFENMGAQQQSTTPISGSSVPRKNIQARAAVFTQKTEETVKTTVEHVPRQLDASKTAFLTETKQEQVETVTKAPERLDQSKIEQFTTKVSESNGVVKEEVTSHVQETTEAHTYEDVREEIYQNVQEISKQQYVAEDSEYTAEEIQDGAQEEEIVDTGLTAVALYDYQAAADDEISFDPEDIITHVETIHEGWWRGLCKGKHGLFPANYVQLQQ